MILEDVLSYRITLKTQMKRVFVALYPKGDYIRAHEARKAIEHILGLEPRYWNGRLLTEALLDLKYKKVKYVGRMMYRPKRRTRHG
jgi:hypothetical protein